MSSNSTIGFQLPDGSDSPKLLAIYWVQFVLALIFVCLRIYARRLIHGLGWDDWVILAAMVRDFIDYKMSSRSCLLIT